MAKQLGFYVDLSACSGCKACQIACKDKNDLDDGRMWRRVVEVEGGEWFQQGEAWITNVFSYYITTACYHCEDAPCMNVCPAKAIDKREDGIVLIDEDKCIGCRYCEWACPYGAPQVNNSGVITKCDMCYDYVDAGQSPACVSVCPMRALHFGDMDELRARYGTLNNVYPLPDPDLAKPAVVFKPHKDAILTDSGSATIANKEEI